MIEVSVIIPVYNCEKYLRGCLDSVIVAYRDMAEIILVNDGSTDSSLAICNEYQRRFPNQIKVYTQENSGASTARNVGLAQAVGRYVHFVDADDKVLVEGVSAFLENTTDCDTYDIYCYNHQTLTYRGVAECNGFENNSLVDSIGYLRMHTSMYLWDKLIRRAVIEDVRFLDGISNTEDMLFCLQAVLKASSIRINCIPIYEYNQTNANSTLSNRKLSSLLKNSQDTLTVNYRLLDIYYAFSSGDLKNELLDRLRFGACSHLYALYVDRLPISHINSIICQYKLIGLYPLMRSYNRRGNLFALLANVKPLFLGLIWLQRLFCGGKYKT